VSFPGCPRGGILACFFGGRFGSGLASQSRVPFSCFAACLVAYQYLLVLGGGRQLGREFV
jgi:hypothetical protein